jgi:hypothetical protein
MERVEQQIPWRGMRAMFKVQVVRDVMPKATEWCGVCVYLSVNGE